MIENIDRWLGIYFDALERRGDGDHTIVIWSSDHGEMLGDHNRWHKSDPRHGSLSIPLVVSGPGVELGSPAAPVDLADLARTILDLAGVEPSRDMDGESLVPALRYGELEPRTISAGLDGWRLLFDGRLKYIHNWDDHRGASGDDGAWAPVPGASEALYDLVEDPGETRNLARERPAFVRSLRARLARVLASTGASSGALEEVRGS